MTDDFKKNCNKKNKIKSDLMKIFDKIKNEDIINNIINKFFEEFKKVLNFVNEINLNKLTTECDELINPLLERKIK